MKISNKDLHNFLDEKEYDKFIEQELDQEKKFKVQVKNKKELKKIKSKNKQEKNKDEQN